MIREQEEKLRLIEQEKNILIAKRKQIEEELMSNSRHYLEIVNISKYQHSEIGPVIAYLVSLIEEKEFKYYEYLLPLSTLQIPVKYLEKHEPPYSRIHDRFRMSKKQIHEHDLAQYVLSYISCDEEEATKEIKEKWLKFYYFKENGYYFPFQAINAMLFLPANNYIQLDCYNMTYDNIRVEFVNNLNQSSKYGQSRIVDERYLYIIDFTNYLTIEKLKSENYMLSLEQMMECARKFAKQYKRELSGDNVKQKIIK